MLPPDDSISVRTRVPVAFNVISPLSVEILLIIVSVLRSRFSIPVVAANFEAV